MPRLGCGSLDLVRYGSGWKIRSFTSNYAGSAPALGIVGKTTLGEYEARLK